MKTPRELILAKHGVEAPVLDALRRAVLPEPRVGTLEFLRLIFWPRRLVWGALAAVWVVVLILGSARRPHTNAPVPPQELMAEWTANKDKLHDLLAETGPNR